MLPSFLSPTHLYTNYLRRRFTSAGLTSQVTKVDDEANTTIRFWGPDPIKRPTGKPSLVLIHGFGPVSTWQWQNQVQHFAPKFDLYVPDLVFFGESTTRLADRSEQFQAESVAGLMERIGVERYSLLGTSYGGIVAYNIAKRWPERVVRVVIASSGVNMRRRDGVGLRRRNFHVRNVVVNDRTRMQRMVIGCSDVNNWDLQRAMAMKNDLGLRFPYFKIFFYKIPCLLKFSLR